MFDFVHQVYGLFSKLMTPQAFLQTTTSYQTVIVPVIDEVLIKLVLYTKEAPLFKQLEVKSQSTRQYQDIV